MIQLSVRLEQPGTQTTFKRSGRKCGNKVAPWAGNRQKGNKGLLNGLYIF